MFVHDFVLVDVSADAVLRRLDDPDRSWLVDHAEAGAADGDAVFLRIGLPGAGGRIRKKTEVIIEQSYVRSDATVYQICWRATGVPWLFPELRADLEVAPVGEASTQVTLFGRYEPPLGVAGRLADAAALHRVAEACVRGFLTSLAERLRQEAATR